MRKIFFLVMAVVVAKLPVALFAEEGIIPAATAISDRQQEPLCRKPKFDAASKLYYYAIKSVSYYGGSVTLEDDSVFDVGLLSMPTTQGWEPGDLVALWYVPTQITKSIKMCNVTKEQIGWADIYSLPKKYSRNGLWVAWAEDDGAKVYLNNGVSLRSPHSCFRNINFREGSRVILLSSYEEEKAKYALWLEKGLIAFDLELVR